MAAKAFAHRFAGTAPTQHLFGLRVALDILLHEEGLEAAWNRHTLFARAVWAAVEAWGAGGDMRLNIRDAAGGRRVVEALRLRVNTAAPWHEKPKNRVFPLLRSASPILMYSGSR